MVRSLRIRKLSCYAVLQGRKGRVPLSQRRHIPIPITAHAQCSALPEQKLSTRAFPFVKLPRSVCCRGVHLAIAITPVCLADVQVSVTPGGSRPKLVFSDQEICDDILATMPKLQAAVRSNAKGERWRHSTGKGGVHLAQMKPYTSTAQPDDDLDILHAVAAKTELRCHLNEALSVLLHQDTDGYDSTMKALCGKQFTKGDVLFHQRVALGPDCQKQTRIPVKSESDNTFGTISVTSATVRPGASLKTRLQARRSRTQQLVFSTYTHRSAQCTS
ncbi:hypothetical protein PHYPSEUDO_005374 [Phytophthora pseudosyringae]|uniref:Uncharacterized protein n=1 Tax=Phytophthora pseudosyringae TaxID=221518 RepID=A0A8T1VPN4_9STRA|nr:hypothetical protein PHYPSEUDO_005374 [Phytophthora pseudosyringae]